MAETGYNWGAWAFVQKGAADWSADALADAAEETGDSTSLDVIAACEVGVSLAEPNVGAISGEVTIYVLREIDGTWEVSTQGSPWGLLVTPVQNATVVKVFSIDPSMVGAFKVSVENQSGQSLNVTVKYRTATIPVAS